LLTSKDKDVVLTALEVYASEAKAGHAPTGLEPIIDRIQANVKDERVMAATAKAITAINVQEARDRCFLMPDGTYVHVANSAEQYGAGRALARLLSRQDLPGQGAQR